MLDLHADEPLRLRLGAALFRKSVHVGDVALSGNRGEFIGSRGVDLVSQLRGLRKRVEIKSLYPLVGGAANLRDDSLRASGDFNALA